MAQNIAARAYQLRDERFDTALLLATEAQRLATEALPGKLLPDAFGTLLTTAYYNPRLLTHLHWNSPVNAVAFSHDGKLVATGDFDGNVVLWDAERHRIIETLPGLANDAVRAIAFSTDGRYMAVSSNSVWLRDLVKGENRLLPQDVGVTPPVFALAFSSDAKLLAYGDKKGNIVIRDMMADSSVTLRAPPESEVRGLSFGQDAKLLAAGFVDGRISIWSRPADAWVAREDLEFAHQHLTDPELDPERRAENVLSDSKRKEVHCLAVAPDGKYLAAGRASGAVDLYDLSLSDPSVNTPPSPLNVAAFGRHDGLVNSLAFDANSKRLITAGNDGTLRLWEVPPMKQIGQPFTGHVGRVFCVAFSGDAGKVASGGEDRNAILWDSKLSVTQTVREEKFANFSVAFSPDGAWEAYGYPKDPKNKASEAWVTLKKRDDGDGKEYSRKLPPASADGKVYRSSLSAAMASGWRRRCQMVSCGCMISEMQARILPCDRDRLLSEDSKRIMNGSSEITAIGLSHDGAMVAAGIFRSGKVAELFAWKVKAREPIFEALSTSDETRILAITFSPDGRLLVTGGNAERAVIWSVGENGEPQPWKCPELHTGSIRSVAFSPDGKTFATASGDTTLILWETPIEGQIGTVRQIAPPLTGHQAPVLTAAFSRDGKLLASGSAIIQ